jgi:hypothetical protein
MLDAADQLRRVKLAVERQHALADVLGEVADALEVVGDPQRAHDLPQIDRHGLPAGDGQHGLFLDFLLQRIDAGIGGDGPLREVGIAVGERVDRIRDLLLGKAAHFSNHAGELLQVDVEGLGGVFGHYHLRRPELCCV